MEKLKFQNFVLFCIFLKSALTIDLKLSIDERTIDPINFIIPTLNSENVMCKNHSLLYRNELSKSTVWAIDMFDSSTKFPTGVFFGSQYDTGNFDECIGVHLPKSMGFFGQHCMVHVKIRSLKPISTTSYAFQYEKMFNITIWEKIEMFARDPRKQNRNEMFVSYCIPSTCTHTDLESVLKQKVDFISKNLSFIIDVNVDKRNCQVETEVILTKGDKIFMGIVGVMILFQILCTSYHLSMKWESAKHFQLSGKVHDVLRAFSYSHSAKKLFDTSHKEIGLECLDGLKVLSTFVIIMGHRVMFNVSSPISNPVSVEEAYDSLSFAGFLFGPIIVDTFFTVSGFLACYHLLIELQRRKGHMNPLVVYLHRLVRLTPAYVVVLGFYMTIFVHLGNGPFWSERVGVEQERCLESWWTNLLYINNYVKVDKTCMFQSWYLSSDMQFFLAVPFLSYLLWKKPKAGIICCLIVISVAFVVNFMVIYINGEDPFILLYIGSSLPRDPVTDLSYQRIHVPSHMRATPYFTGVMAAYLKFKIRNSQHKISSWMRQVFWILFGIIIIGLHVIAMSFYSRAEPDDYFIRGLFGAGHHFLWGIAISWCIVAVSEGHGQLAVSVLNSKIWKIPGKLTFTIYICHAAVLLYTTGTKRYPTHMGIFNLLKTTSSDIIFSCLVSICVSLSFESPILELEKILLGRNRQELRENTIAQGNCDDVIKETTFANDCKQN